MLFKAPTDYDQFSVRFDQHFSDKDSFFPRASYVNHNLKEQDVVAALENPLWSFSDRNDPRNYAVSETHILSPTLLSTVAFTLNRQIEGQGAPSVPITTTTFADGSLANYGPDSFYAWYDETYFEPCSS